jgi:hypothetical protein
MKSTSLLLAAVCSLCSVSLAVPIDEPFSSGQPDLYRSGGSGEFDLKGRNEFIPTDPSSQEYWGDDRIAKMDPSFDYPEQVGLESGEKEGANPYLEAFGEPEPEDYEFPVLDRASKRGAISDQMEKDLRAEYSRANRLLRYVKSTKQGPRRSGMAAMSSGARPVGMRMPQMPPRAPAVHGMRFY